MFPFKRARAKIIARIKSQSVCGMGWGVHIVRKVDNGAGARHGFEMIFKGSSDTRIHSSEARTVAGISLLAAVVAL